jgi:uncharacterized protein (TIGR03435 family)
MFNRFTQPAIKVIFFARSEVSRLGSSAMEPEHILLGVLDEQNGLGSRILARAGDALDEIRSDIAGRLTGGEKVSESDEIPFSASCQRALEYAAEVLAGRGLTIEGVREGIVELLGRGEQPELPSPPATPANTYRWPQIPFVPSRTVHILHSGMQWPTQPVINHGGPVFCAYGFTLEEIIVRSWEGSRWHVDITPGLRDDARFDFLTLLPQQETTATCLGLFRSAIEQQFAVEVTRETRMRDVYRLTATNPLGPMLWRYPDPDRGFGCPMVSFSVFMNRSKETPIFPIEGFAVHSVPFILLVSWFEEILGGQVIDETVLPGIYGFELKERVDTPEALIQLLRDKAGLVITRERRETPTLVVRSTC